MENQGLVAGAMKILKENGKKQTKRREIIIDYLARSNRYVSPKEIHLNLTKEYPGLSQDTIYRNLREFAEFGILEETELNGEMNFRFNCIHPSSKHHHHHFICTNCGATKPLDLCPMTFYQEQLPNCIIEDHRFEIFGKCEKCVSLK